MISSRITGRCLRSVSGRMQSASVGGGDAWSPASLSNLLQWFDPAYSGTALQSLPVLVPKETGTLAVPRGQRCYLADGTDDTISWTAANTGTQYVTYYNPATATWVSPVTLTHNGSAYVFAPGNIRFFDLKRWSIASPTSGQIQARDLVTAGAGLVSWHPCQEESGTTALDIANATVKNGTLNNITQGSFHSTHSGVDYSYPNQKGYTLSGAVVIPRNEASPTLDAAGNALGNMGPISLPATTEVACITGDGTAYVNCNAELIPKSGDFELSVWVYPPASPANYQNLIAQSDTTNAWNSTFQVFYENPPGSWFVTYGSYAANKVAVSLPGDQWSLLRIRKVGTTLFASANGGTESSTTCTATITGGSPTTLLASFSSGVAYIPIVARIAGLAITQSGVTKYPLFDQCGPGSSNTNRDFYIVGSDGTATLVSGGITSGTVSSIFANRCPYVKDWCIQFGGGIAANGSFVPGLISGSNDAAGNAKTLAAGKHGNPFSRVVPNYWNSPALVNRGVDSSDKLTPANTYESITTASDDGFSRNAAGGTDRYFATNAALTGADLTNADGYVA